jgi:PAS domain S-box-containing protein
MATTSTPIKRRIKLVMLLTSLTVLGLTSSCFVIYEWAASRQDLEKGVRVVAQIIAANSGPYLLAQRRDEARTMLSTLAAAKQILSAALYDDQQRLFAYYPTNASPSLFPVKPPPLGRQFTASRLRWCVPVSENGVELGALLMESNLTPVYQHVRLYTLPGLLVIIGAVLVAWFLTNYLQSSISQPILDLAKTARIISERRDYSVRASKSGPDELGILTDAFNDMLNQIQTSQRLLKEKEEAQALLAAIVEFSDDAIIGKDLKGTIITWNQGAERMFGYTRSEIVGKPITLLTAPDRPDEEERILERIRGGASVEHYETVRFRKDGTPVQLSLSVSPIRNSRGQIVGISSIGRDITERKQAEEEVRRLNAGLEQRVHDRTAELTQSNEELEAFTYSVSHDLRAPLRHVDAFARILEEELISTATPEICRMIGRIRHGTQMMGQLVDDLLNLSRVSRAPLARQPIDLNRMLQEVIADLRHETGSRAIEWRISELPTVAGDPGLLKQVLANLLSNAVKYTRTRAPAVIEVSHQPQAGESVFVVRDNGVGFNMKYVDKLFGVFERLHRAEEFEGTGIGLALVRRILQRHGGRIWAEAEPEKGAAFYFTLGKPDGGINHCQTRADR